MEIIGLIFVLGALGMVNQFKSTEEILKNNIKKIKT